MCVVGLDYTCNACLHSRVVGLGLLAYSVELTYGTQPGEYSVDVGQMLFRVGFHLPQLRIDKANLNSLPSGPCMCYFKNGT